MFRSLIKHFLVLTLLPFVFPPLSYAAGSFTAFESGQVRPLAISPDGTKLFAVNTPDNRLEIFNVDGSGLIPTALLPVGMEPISVAARNNNEVWVVNHLSDSVSIVDVSSTPPHIVRTLLVGDEPRDIVFAGSTGNRAFISTAHRGQNSPYGPAQMPGDPGEITTPGVGRADVWVFDADNLGSQQGGTPLTILTHFTDTPRALAVSPNKDTVYVAGFHTGNQTTTINDGAVCNGGSIIVGPCGVTNTAPGGLPAPNTLMIDGLNSPETGLIVKFNGSQWVDERGFDWSNQVLFNLPDKDVFAIDANASTPVETTNFSGVGTVLFNMATNPISGKVYVSNTEAKNEVRFEGTRTMTSNTSVIGHQHEARITVIDSAVSSVLPRHLNKHINYSINPAPAGVKDNSLATPMGMAVSPDGNTLYLAAFGSSKIGVFNTGELENDSFIPDSANHITVTGGGPSGLVLDDTGSRLYVLTRFDNSISVIDTTTNTETAHYALYNPEPPNVVAGRPFLYDAKFTSSNGEASCSSCHVFADFDSLAWDLGNPEGSVLSNPNLNGPISAQGAPYHPLKGPMTTQSLRGLTGQGPLHWRGDRTAGHSGGDPMDSAGAFMEFNVAFVGLLGRESQLSALDMASFTSFTMDITYPPNPNRPLDNSLTPSQQAGSDFFFTAPSTVGLTCNACHVIDPANGLFGSSGLMSFDGEAQVFKIAHLRNMYQKAGMFGMPINDSIIPGDNVFMEDQVRGFGFIHDGSVDNLFRFHSTPLFTFPSDTDRRNVEQFMHGMDTNLAPIVGQQITLTDTNATTVNPRIDLLILRAAAGDSDLIVKGTISGSQKGWRRRSDGMFESDSSTEAALTDNQLRALAQTAGQPLTYTATPPGSGIRMGIDRDEDGVLDNDDSCPANPDPSQIDTDNDGLGNPCDSDDDNDGLSDTFEQSIGTNTLLIDSDGDGLSDYTEVNFDGNPNSYIPGTDLNPLLADTDGDTIADSTDPIPLTFNFNDGDLAPLGSPDGIINAADSLIAMRIVTGNLTATILELSHGDLYPVGAPDGAITISDLILLMKLN